MNNLRIEQVGDINSEYPYLEVFFENLIDPFLEVEITPNKELSLKFYSSKADIKLTVEEYEYILSISKKFLTTTLKNEDDFLKFSKE